MRRSSILPLLLALLFAAGTPARAGTPADHSSRKDPARAMVDSAAARKVFSGVRHLLDREDPGWDRDTIRSVMSELRGDPLGMAGMGRSRAHALGGRSPLRVALTLIVLVVGIGTLQALVMRRRFQRAVEGAERILARRIAPSVATLSAAAVGTILPAILPFAVLLSISLARAARPVESPLLDVLADFAWLWTLATLLLAGTREALGRRVLGCPQGPARYLASGVRWLVIFSIVVVGLLYLAERSGAPPDRVRFFWFVYKAILFLMAAAILLRKPAVMAVFPDLPRPAYRRFLKIFSTSYYPVLLFSLGVAVLHLAGWRALGEFVWRRTWLVAALFLAVIAADQVVGNAIRGALRKEEEGPLSAGRTPARELERALLGALRLGEVIVLTVTLVKLFEADGPVARLAMVPMITVGARAVSLWMILQAAAVIAGAVYLSRVIRAFLDYKLYPAVEMDPGAGSAVNWGITCLLLVVSVLVAMRLVGIDLKTVAIFTGALGVGVGFGLQHVVNNMVSGLTLIFGRALKPGDWVTVESRRGQIAQVGMRSTRIRSGDNVDFFVPNATLLQTTIVNWTHDDPRARIAARYLVDSRADVARVKALLLRVAASHPRVLPRPEPEVQFPEMGEKGLVFDLLVWIDFRVTSEGSVRSDLNYRVWEEFQREGIAIPVQEIDVRVVPREPR